MLLTFSGCRPGTYVRYGDRCNPCGIGRYNSNPTATSCSHCPDGWTTTSLEAKWSWDCKQGDVSIRIVLINSNITEETDFCGQLQ